MCGGAGVCGGECVVRIEQEDRDELTAERVDARLGELAGELDRLLATGAEAERVRSGDAGDGDAEGDDERVDEAEPEARSAETGSAAAPAPAASELGRDRGEVLAQLATDESEDRRCGGGREDED